LDKAIIWADNKKLYLTYLQNDNRPNSTFDNIFNLNNDEGFFCNLLLLFTRKMTRYVIYQIDQIVADITT
jgi:hypothetical protein